MLDLHQLDLHKLDLHTFDLDQLDLHMLDQCKTDLHMLDLYRLDVRGASGMRATNTRSIWDHYPYTPNTHRPPPLLDFLL